MSRVRTFVAIEIDAAIRREAARLIQRLKSFGADVRWVDQDNIHLTLKFLGDVDDVELPEVCRLAARAANVVEPVQVVCRGLGAFPSTSRPRTIWMGLDEPTGRLARLHEALETNFAQMGFPAERRQFVPHLTLGRVSRATAHLGQLVAELQKHAEQVWGEFPVDEIVVFSSQLTPSGPVYTPLSHCELGGEGDE